MQALPELHGEPSPEQGRDPREIIAEARQLADEALRFVEQELIGRAEVIEVARDEPVSTSRSANRTGGFPASGFHKDASLTGQGRNQRNKFVT